ncbi:protein NDNF-like [Diadema antillarum]|uniref:protein NDNF-like n=1 Tax=Diadema antillarum TaxID=105358 RepID=UPI003A893D51
MNSLLKPPLTFFLPLLLLVSRAKLSPSQRLPSNIFDDPELFHENGIIPNGREMTDYAFPDRSKRYFFSVEEDNTPVVIVVTPCSARIEWNLSLLDPPEDGSGSSAADQLSEQRPRRQSNTRIGTNVKSFSGYEVGKYVTYSSPAGIYVLEVRSVERGCAFQVYATLSPDSDYFFPELPSDPRLDVTGFSKNRVSLAWKPSPSDSVHHQPVRYCLAINTRLHYHTWCGVQSSVSGGQLPLLTSPSGFGFASERALRKARKRIQRKQALLNSSEEASDLVVECVGRKTLHTVTNLEPGVKYFFDLFAVDENTNRSVAYTGTTLTTQAENADPKVLRLKDGRYRTASVRRMSSVKLFRFPVSEKTEGQDVVISVHSCSKPVMVEIWREEVKIRESSVKSLKKFNIRNVRSELIIKVRSKRRSRTSSFFKIFATTNPSKYSFPVLPKDSRINVFRNLRQCTSVTLAWKSTSDASKYCLYMREESRDSRTTDNRCHEPSMHKRNEKVICRDVDGAAEEREVLTEMVTGLRPGTTYTFDVYVTSGIAQPPLATGAVAYKSKRVKTKRTCDD